MTCPDYNNFTKWITQFDQSYAIEKEKDKRLRYDVWKTTSEDVQGLTENLTTSGLKNADQSSKILSKLENALKRITQSSATGGKFQEEVLNNQYNKEMAIAMREVMEAVKGEADKARNNGIDITEISNDGFLPVVPLSRLAATIGRKIAYQKGYRFKRASKKDDAIQVESLYYDVGNAAIQLLVKKNYLKVHDNIGSIQDYVEQGDLKKDFPNQDPTRNDVLSVSLNANKLGVKRGTSEANYFLQRTDVDLGDTDLGVIVDKLAVANAILQPSTIVLPYTGNIELLTDEYYTRWDDGIKQPDPKTEKARRLLHDNPNYINSTLNNFLETLAAEQAKSGTSASKQILKVFGSNKKMIANLFGLKRSDDFSIDKKESVKGQNLSKTVPMDDLVEYLDMLLGQPLHMLMKIGRNGRLYYLNSVLNAHGSKSMRYMLTPGPYTVATNSSDFDYLVYQIHEALGETFSWNDIVNGNATIDEGLQILKNFKTNKDFQGQAEALALLAKKFRGIDFVTVTTALQAIQDIRSSNGQTVTTEFPVSADATASGGTLTFLQALGSNPAVADLLRRIGLLKPGDQIEKTLPDLYGLITEAVEKFMEGNDPLGTDLDDDAQIDLMRATVQMLFKEQNRKVREFSKDPTMTFVYGQGKKSARITLARSLADRILDNIEHPSTRNYLALIMGDDKYKNINTKEILDTAGFYKEVVKKIDDSNITATMYDIMDRSIKEKYLKEHTQRSEGVYALLKKMNHERPFKFLPAGAVMNGIKASDKDALKNYGMPLTKQFWVMNKFKGRKDTVLTKFEKLMKTVQDVSTIHGTDAALLYHSLADVNPKDGVVAIHDDVRGSVQTVRAMERQYAKNAQKMASEYDIHQQIMEAIAVQDPELAKTKEFKDLKAEIDAHVAEKKTILKTQFDENTTALIGNGDRYARFAKRSPESASSTQNDTEATADTEAEAQPEPAATPTGTVSQEQDFGGAFMTISEGDVNVDVLAQEYWDSTKQRLDMVEKLRVCLKS